MTIAMAEIREAPATPFQGFDASASSVLKGYRMKDFQDAWERYAGPPATAKFRSRVLNSIKFRSFRDSATFDLTAAFYSQKKLSA